MVNLEDMDMGEIRDHYLMRERIHLRLGELFEAANVRDFVRLALGMSDRAGNYSASEHQMGPRILAAARAEPDVFDLATIIQEIGAVNLPPRLNLAIGLHHRARYQTDALIDGSRLGFEPKAALPLTRGRNADVRNQSRSWKCCCICFICHATN
jgi:hypothetical protein